MGKRRERRLAAMSAAGRRVKLDLFAEPSGEMVDKSSKDEIKGDPDRQDNHAGVPSSPSTSGQNQENPLLLLGQYSDDEVNDDENGEAVIKVEGNRSDNAAREDEGADISGNVGNMTDQVIDAGNIKQDVDEVVATNSTDNQVVHPELGQKGTDSTTEACAADLTTQIVGNITDGWQMVMHEETNQYYYWNILTGETSWEVPDVISHRSATSTAQNGSVGPEGHMDNLAHVHASIGVNASVVGDGNDRLIAQVTAASNGFITDRESGLSGTGMAYDATQASLNYASSGTSNISYPENFPPHSFATLAQSNALPEHLVCSGADLSLMSGGEGKDLLTTNSGFESAEIHSAQLVKYGERLLQRLKMLKGSDGRVQMHDWTVKYILEVETRVSDCKALSSYGSSLLPFWWYTETQLKRIESLINQDDSMIHDYNNCDKEASLGSSLMPENSLGNRVHKVDIKDDSHDTALDADNMLGLESTSKEIIEQTNDAPMSEDAANIEKLPSGDHEVEANETVSSPIPIPLPSGDTRELHDEEETKASLVSVSHVSGSEVGYLAMSKDDKTHVNPKVELSEGEDVDMDVEMEVDEEVPTLLLACGSMPHAIQLEQPVVANFIVSHDLPSASAHEENVPPPPDEEWIPPPPPEDESIPPPPPEEPPLPCVPPPPYADNVPSFSYPEHYNVGYPVSAFEYYAPPMSEATATIYYPHEVSHAVEPQPPTYYDQAAGNSFTEPNVDANNAADPIVYYDISAQISAQVPVETSRFYIQSSSSSYNDANISTADNSGSVMIFKEYASSLPTCNHEPTMPSIVNKPEKVTESSASISTTQSTGTAAVNVTSSESMPTIIVKSQPKVARGKKRTVAVTSTLRSNKKVSSLVDKWKAAKEELHGDEEDEPENAYEVLEKKRQKEIEEWKARQISSGEAQENANFLPLGGDWRERVKRRRAESNVQPTHSPSEQVSDEKKPPDLVELTKDLPPGWQAYWDESSREVYYGNAQTSETTWVRPSR